MKSKRRMTRKEFEKSWIAKNGLTVYTGELKMETDHIVPLKKRRKPKA